MLASLLTFAAAEKRNRHLQESDLSDTWGIGPSLAGSLRAKNAMPPTDFLPVQSKNARSLGAGKVLVASRNLGDPHFVKTVILLVRYDAQGVLGLILNRRTDIPISRALEGVKAAKDRSDPAYLGGPVGTAAVFALFRSPAKIEGAEPIFDGVYLVTSKPLFEQTISARPDPRVFHVYLGYAGWTQEQLQKEVELGAWFIFPAEARTVFTAAPDSLWQEMIGKTELEFARSEPGSWLVSIHEVAVGTTTAGRPLR
jgi:putative transcriptional regulator